MVEQCYNIYILSNILNSNTGYAYFQIETINKQLNIKQKCAIKQNNHSSRRNQLEEYFSRQAEFLVSGWEALKFKKINTKTDKRGKPWNRNNAASFFLSF